MYEILLAAVVIVIMAIATIFGQIAGFSTDFWKVQPVVASILMITYAIADIVIFYVAIDEFRHDRGDFRAKIREEPVKSAVELLLFGVWRILLFLGPLLVVLGVVELGALVLGVGIIIDRLYEIIEPTIDEKTNEQYPAWHWKTFFI